MHPSLEAGVTHLGLLFYAVSALDEPISALDEPISALDEPISALDEPIPALDEPISALEEPIPALEGRSSDFVGQEKWQTHKKCVWFLVKIRA